MAILRRLKRFILLQRIDMLRTDILIAVERRDQALQTVESIDRWQGDAQRRLRSLKGKLTMLERPGTLLAEALRHE